MSILYKDVNKIKTKVCFLDQQIEGEIKIKFVCDGGKHGCEEILDTYSLKPERLLKILQNYKDYKDEELS